MPARSCPSRPARRKGQQHWDRRAAPEQGFLCIHCRGHVSTSRLQSGVRSRNHCPYCLWSRHLDLFQAGDRLSACKAPMHPLGLTVKLTSKKFGPGLGELMLIHLCSGCGTLSINRLAADDDLQSLWAVFISSRQLEGSLRSRLKDESILMLMSPQAEAVSAQLFGRLNHPDNPPIPYTVVGGLPSDPGASGRQK